MSHYVCKKHGALLPHLVMKWKKGTTDSKWCLLCHDEMMTFFCGGLTRVEDKDDSVLDMEIEALEIRTRAMHELREENIRTLRDLVSKSEIDLLRMVNFGPKSLMDVKRALAKHGLELKK